VEALVDGAVDRRVDARLEVLDARQVGADQAPVVLDEVGHPDQECGPDDPGPEVPGEPDQGRDVGEGVGGHV
jgi:hypothetical protein